MRLFPWGRHAPPPPATPPATRYIQHITTEEPPVTETTTMTATEADRAHDTVPGRDVSIELGSMSLTEGYELDWFLELLKVVLQNTSAGDRVVLDFGS